MVKGLAILGCTGSIGRQALDVVRRFPESFRVVGLAGWANQDLLVQQMAEFSPVLVSSKDGRAGGNASNVTHSASLLDIVRDPAVDLVVMAIAGSPSLEPTIEALRAGKAVALASKEAIVMAGPLIADLVAEGAKLLPVDSEASAIWQCLQGEPRKIRRLIITASGGPFRTRAVMELAYVTPAEALRHPTWNMGRKITVDSATLMNKALEVIESRWLFDVPWEQIEVVIHPQSIVHSFVEFQDGSVKAQMGQPDMRLPLQYALFHPQRMAQMWSEPLDIAGLGALKFEPLEAQRFPCFTIAVDAAKVGGTYPAVLCAVDDVAVDLFLKGIVAFTDIPEIIERVLDDHRSGDGRSLDGLLEAEAWARSRALEVAKALR